MAILLEQLLLVLVGLVVGVVLARVFAKPSEAQRSTVQMPLVKLVRTGRTVEGYEETRLLLNGQVVLTASNDGARLAEYADEVEQLEALAARLARGLGVGVEFERVAPRTTGRPGDSDSFNVRDLPPVVVDELDAEERRRRLNRSEDAA